MTFPHLEVATVPLAAPEIQVVVANTPLPPGMRLHCLRSDVASSVRHARPRLPSLPAVAPAVPAVGVTALAAMFVRDRRRVTR